MPAVLACSGQRVAVAVDDQARQAVRLGMDQAVEGRGVEALAQRQRAPSRRLRSHAASIDGAGSRSSTPRRDQAVRVEVPHAVPRAVIALQADGPPGGSGLRRRGHRDLVGEGPRVARLHPPVAAGQQAQQGQVRTIEVRHGGGGTSPVRRLGATAGPLDLASWNRYGRYNPKSSAMLR